MREPTVFIVDDDPSVRRSLVRLVRATGIDVESFASAAELLAAARHDGPGCIVLDVRMPGMNGPALQEELGKRGQHMPIVFLSGHGDVPTTALAMKRGAVDFLTKPVDRDDLLAAIRLSLAQDAQYRARQAEYDVIDDRVKTLTPREYEVMTYVIAGMLNKQIAVELDISEETVKIHRGRVMQKLGLTSVAELARLCVKADIVPAQSRQR